MGDWGVLDGRWGQAWITIARMAILRILGQQSCDLSLVISLHRAQVCVLEVRPD